jgi:hypothetical protein
MTIEQLTYAILNDVVSGLVGLHENVTISEEQLQDEVVALRESIIIEKWRRGLLHKNDLLTAINCIEVDCKDSTKCCTKVGKSEMHFEIPQLVSGIGGDAIA